MQTRALPLAWLFLIATAVALPVSQSSPKPVSEPPSAQLNSAENLYLQLQNTALSKTRVYRVRDVSIDRAAIQITLNDGTIAFTRGRRRSGDRSLL